MTLEKMENLGCYFGNKWKTGNFQALEFTKMYFSINAHFLNILISNNINLSFIRKALQRNPLVFFFFKDFIYLLLERGEKKEKERERNINVWWLPLARPLTGTWPATQTCALTRNQTGDPLVHRPALNPLSHTSQGSTCFLDGKC